jgi:hypothetical protein
MIEQTRKQPFKATADMMIRYKGLNNTLTPIAQNPIFYFINVNVGDSLVSLPILYINYNSLIFIR